MAADYQPMMLILYIVLGILVALGLRTWSQRRSRQEAFDRRFLELDGMWMSLTFRQEWYDSTEAFEAMSDMTSDQEESINKQAWDAKKLLDEVGLYLKEADWFLMRESGHDWHRHAAEAFGVIYRLLTKAKEIMDRADDDFNHYTGQGPEYWSEKSAIGSPEEKEMANAWLHGGEKGGQRARTWFLEQKKKEKPGGIQAGKRERRAGFERRGDY